MVMRGFCEHGKVWTTCQICGKDVIAAQSNKRSEVDDFGDVRPKKKIVKQIPEEPPEDMGGREEEAAD